ncbi:MAG: histidine phosphatase family protein [archaeon]
MRLYLIRHAERGHGEEQDTLTSEGMEQSKKLAEYLKKINVDKIICADTNRARKTAEPFLLFNLKNITIEYTKEANEQDIGDLHGKTGQEWRDAVSNSGLKKEEFTPPNGESAIDAYNRAVLFVDRLKKEGAKNILVFSHSGFISNVASILLGKIRQESTNYKSDFCALTYFELSNDFKVKDYKINEKII